MTLPQRVRPCAAAAQFLRSPPFTADEKHGREAMRRPKSTRAMKSDEKLAEQRKELEQRADQDQDDQHGEVEPADRGQDVAHGTQDGLADGIENR